MSSESDSRKTRGWCFTRWEKYFAAQSDQDPWAKLDHPAKPKRSTRRRGSNIDNEQTRRERALHHWRIFEIAQKTGKTVAEIEQQFGLRQRMND